MSVVVWVVAALVAAGCWWCARILGRKAKEARQEAINLDLQNQAAALQFANCGGVDALQSSLGTEERRIVAERMARDGAHPCDEGYYVRRLYGPDFESTYQQARVADAQENRYSSYSTLCRIGIGIAVAAAFAVHVNLP